MDSDILTDFRAGNMRTKVLFLCTGNSCRSQMAEGWLRHLKADQYQAYSAGIEAHGLNPLAVQVMQEAGVDISKQRSQKWSEIGIVPNWLVTVCGHADENCPLLSTAVKKIHVGFDDPPKLAGQASSEQEALNHYRRVRDEIRAFIDDIENTLQR